jgi:hypothetical protein
MCGLSVSSGVLVVILLAAFAFAQTTVPQTPRPLAVRGFHTLMPGYWGGDGRAHIADCERFITDVLGPSGINVLVLEVGYNFQYRSVPRIGNANAVGPDEVKRLLAACRKAGIKLIPQLNCLGHQARSKGSLLGEYPEFQEPPGEYPSFLKDPMPKQAEGTSYCPQNPKVHEVVFALLDELGEVFETDTIHVGMDEVICIASSNCPRCRGKDPAELFAGEVKALHDHLASRGRKMWMWGDRFILASEHGFEDWGWASSRNYTHPAVDRVPKDIVICDWHYDDAPSTPRYFVSKGFATIACPWWDESVALQQLQMMRQMAGGEDAQAASRSLGLMLTTWTDMSDFITAYEGRIPPVQEMPEWQQKGDFPWKAAARSSKVLRALTGAWDLPVAQLAGVVEQAMAAPKLVWSGEAPLVGDGLAPMPEAGSTVAIKPGAGRDGRAAIELRVDGKGAVECYWFWNGWVGLDTATDIRQRTHLSLWIKGTGQRPDSLAVGLGGKDWKQGGRVNVYAYCPEVFDGQWHQLLIPLVDIYSAPLPDFDPAQVQRLDIGTWLPEPLAFTLLITEIGFATVK